MNWTEKQIRSAVELVTGAPLKPKTAQRKSVRRVTAAHLHVVLHQYRISYHMLASVMGCDSNGLYEMARNPRYRFSKKLELQFWRARRALSWARRIGVEADAATIVLACRKIDPAGIGIIKRALSRKKKLDRAQVHREMLRSANIGPLSDPADIPEG